MVDLNIDWLVVKLRGILMKSYHLIMTEKDEGSKQGVGNWNVSVGDVSSQQYAAFNDANTQCFHGKIVRPIKIKLVELTGHVNHFESLSSTYDSSTGNSFIISDKDQKQIFGFPPQALTIRLSNIRTFPFQVLFLGSVARSRTN